MHGPLTIEQLQHGLAPARVGRRVLVLPDATSTNEVALGMTDDPAADGLVVFAEYQTRGRGRLGRGWVSPRGAAILCSTLLIEQERQPSAAEGAGMGGLLTLASAVAACEAIRRAGAMNSAIKWPNDIRVRGRKLGGILVESRPLESGNRAWVIGVGLNCLQQETHFPPDLRASSTSLELESDHAIDRASVARELLRSLDQWLSEVEHRSGTVRDAWISFAEPIGQAVRLRSGGVEYSGRTIDVDPTGGLIVQCDGGTRRWFDPLTTTLA